MNFFLNDEDLDFNQSYKSDYGNDNFSIIRKNINNEDIEIKSNTTDEFDKFIKETIDKRNTDSDKVCDQINVLSKKIKNLEAEMNRPIYESKNITKNEASNEIKRGLVEFIKTGKLENISGLRGIRESFSGDNSISIPSYLIQMTMSSEKYYSIYDHTNHIEVTGRCTLMANRVKTGEDHDLKPVKINEKDYNYDNNFDQETFVIDQSPLLTKLTISDSLRQAHNFDKIIIQQMMYQLNYAQDNLIFNGNGKNEPVGILNYEHYEKDPKKNEFKSIKLLECSTKDIINDPLEQILNLYSSLNSGYIDHNAKFFMSHQMLSIIRRYRKMDGSSIFGIVNENFNSNINSNFSILGHEVVIKNQLSINNEHNILFMNGPEFYTTTAPTNIEMFIDPYQKRPFITIGLQDAIGGRITNPNAAVRLTVKGEEK